MRTSAERDHLERAVRSGYDLGQVLQLRFHDVSTADHPPQCRLIDDDPELQGRRLREQRLTLHASLHPVFDLLIGGSRKHAADDRAGIVLGLEQARQERRLVVSRDGTVERAELTEQFAALMAPELAGQCPTPRETGVTPSQATGDETGQMRADEDTNAVARTAVGEFRDAHHAVIEAKAPSREVTALSLPMV